MGSLPAGLSVHHFVTSVGAYAGLAAIVGLAILVLLHFAQARETSALRDRAEQLLEHVQYLEARLAALASPGRAAAAPGRASGEADQPAAATAAAAGVAGAGARAAGAGAGARAAGAGARAAGAGAGTGGAGAGVGAGGAGAGAGGAEAGAATSAPAAHLAALELPPGPPAGVGAPALSAATRVIPAGVASRVLPAREQVPAGAAAARPVSAAVPAATAAGGRNGVGGHARVTPPPAGIRPAGPARLAGAPVRAASGAGTHRPLPPPPDPHGQRPRGRGRMIFIVAVAVILAAVAAGVIFALSKRSGSRSAATSSVAAQQTTARPTRAGRVQPSTITVAVLNGTPTVGLAHRTAQRLTGAGFREGRISTAADQTRTATTVAYIPGARADALAVAHSLKLGAAAVQPLDANTRAVAFSCTPSPCPADVVVTVGTDLASR